MKTQNTQLRVTLPVQLQGHLKNRADKYGLTLSAYVRNLIIFDIKENEYPTYQASKSTEQSYSEALDERNKAIKTNNIEDLLDN